MHKKKRGQLTIFIIIGLVILLLAALIIYFRSETIVPVQPVEIDDDQIERFVKQCMRQITEDALIRLGQQGGYVDLTEADALPAEMDPFNSEYLAIMEGNLLIPYWLYQDSRGIDKSEMPRLHKTYEGDYSVQWQLEEYILNELNGCIGNFSVFEAQGMTVSENAKPSAEVAITDKNIAVQLNYPIEVRKAQSIETKSEFKIDIPLNLGEVYSLATEIMDYEMRHVFLEKHTLNLISIYSRLDKDYLPPKYGGFHFKQCSDKVVWQFEDVYEDFKDTLVGNVPYIRIEGTDFERIVINEPDQDKRSLRQGIYDGMIHTISDRSYPDVKADFAYYDSMPLELNLGRGGIIEPNSFALDVIFSRVCLFEYQFGYNIKYPVLITLTASDYKVNNRNFVFQFPIQVIIKDNSPRVRYSDVFGRYDIIEKSSDCGPEQMLSAEMKIDVSDYYGNPVDGVSVEFQCGPSFVYDFYDNGTLKEIIPFAQRCFIGSTKEGKLVSRFPQCSGGGALILSGDGYISKTELIGDTLDKEKQLEFSLDKVYEIDMDIRKYYLRKASSAGEEGIYLQEGIVKDCSIGNNMDILQSYEHALVRLTRIDGDLQTRQSPYFAYFHPGNTSRIKIAPGNYAVEISLVRNERFNGELTIKAKSQSKTIPGSLFEKDKEFVYPEEDLLLPSVFTGGAVFNWTVSRDELAGSEKIIFNIFDEGTPVRMEDINAPMEHRQTCSAMNYGRIAPVLI